MSDTQQRKSPVKKPAGKKPTGKELVRTTGSDGGQIEIPVADIKDIERKLLEGQGNQLENPQFMQIKMKHQGTLRYELPDKDAEGENKLVKSFNGIIVFNHRLNSYWDVPFEEGGETGRIPRCFAVDAKHPTAGAEVLDVQSATEDTVEQKRVFGKCRDCYFNQWGSDKDRKGKECRNMWRLFIYTSKDEMLPYQLTLPPSSLKTFQQYAISLMSKSIPMEKVVTHFSLLPGNMKSSVGDFGMKEILSNTDFVYFINEREKLLNFMRSAEFFDTTGEDGEAEDNVPF